MKKALLLISLLIVAVSITGCAKQYSKIYINGFWKVDAYDYNNNFLGSKSQSFSQTMPYTDYDWNSRMSAEEFLKFLDIPYNSYEVIYDKVEQPADNKLIFQTKLKIYLNEGYAYLTIHGTATRY